MHDAEILARVGEISGLTENYAATELTHCRTCCSMISSSEKHINSPSQSKNEWVLSVHLWAHQHRIREIFSSVCENRKAGDKTLWIDNQIVGVNSRAVAEICQLQAFGSTRDCHCFRKVAGRVQIVGGLIQRFGRLFLDQWSALHQVQELSLAALAKKRMHRGVRRSS